MRVTKPFLGSLIVHATFVGLLFLAPPASNAPPARSVFLGMGPDDVLLVLEQQEWAHMPAEECQESGPLEEVLGDPVIADEAYDDAGSFGEGFQQGLGGRPYSGDNAAFDGPGINGTLGIGGGAGGAFGGRPGGGRNLRAGGGGMCGRLAACVNNRGGALLRKNARGVEIGRFPLRHTDARAEASGWLASTQLTQTYENPFDEVVEAVYVFPLPTSAAVSDFVMQIGPRRVIGIVRPREEAQRIYDEARARGKTASLLTQERPNVFTQSVANIAPGGTVDVSITYFHELLYEDGAYEYVLPMTVGPRYVPGAPLCGTPGDGASAGGGVAMDTDEVPDASRITPPVLPAGMRSGRDVSIAVAIDAGVEIRGINSPSHDVDMSRDGPERATVTLSAASVIPDRDFVLRWRVSADDVEPGFIAHRDDEHGGFFSAFLIPPLDPADGIVMPREVTFVLDSSGSMRGIPIETSKLLVRTALEGLRRFDRFNVIQFAGGTGSLAKLPLDATPANVARGLQYVDTLCGAGGTEMLGGIRAWLAQPADSRYLRVVVFLTDGFVGNEEAIHATIRDEGQDARWFALGIGSSVNRHLVEGIAEFGHGYTEIVLPRESGSAERAARRLLGRFDTPLLVDVEIDSNGLPIEDLQPRRIKDLFPGQPIVVTGRYTGAARGDLLFRGRSAGRDVAMAVPLDLPEYEEAHTALPAIWARTRVHGIEGELAGTDGQVRAGLLTRIENLGLEFHLVTRRTSFVAVDEARVVGDGRPIRILQPQELPDGIRYWGHVGRPPANRAAAIDRWGLTVAESRRGELEVVAVERDGAAARAGIYRSFVIETVAGRAVSDVDHLETLLLQASGDEMRIGYRNGAGEAVRSVTILRP